ncbi:adenylate cyclase [Enterococcus villorum]|uniref:Adenylate cyclase n=1 Tax=Enterococcus villorum TaxID=112904 RepID=A0A1V8YDV2_9ENTE|nr:CYTH domain-containing protein [Enterococcus villorum]OQO70476.1 adenylate cyclase [Enterococcus villorum]OQO76056.1 adenylate cyclase [Enterococcus villorum]
MSEMLEIEYKSMLTQKEYAQLIQHYQLKATDFTVQTNVYFDTTDAQLAKKKCGLRIRLLETHAEYTLKSPTKKGKLETTDILKKEEAISFIEHQKLPLNGAVFQKLAELNIQSEELHAIGELTTKRAEFHIKEGLLAIDESFGKQLHDFELELEVTDPIVGKADFLAFLKSFSFPYRPAKNKIQRMIEAKD